MSVKIGVIIASNRPTRLGPKIAEWFVDQVKDTPGVELKVIDLAKVDLPWLDEPKLPSQGDYEHEHTKKWSAMIEPLDGFVLVTPEYNSGYPASLKNALDTIYHEWTKKPVSFVGYGALGATAAIEQLVNITAKLEMVPLVATGTVTRIIEAWGVFDEDGNFDESHRRGATPERLLENLVWWAKALKIARKS